MIKKAIIGVIGLMVVGVVALAMTGMFSDSAAAFTCPYTGAQLPTEYARVSILPAQKYVGEGIKIAITDISKEGSESPAQQRLVLVYYIRNERVVSEYSIYTDNSGKVTFTPEDSGKYAIATSNRYLFFDVLSRCGDDRCSVDENRMNCADDCAKCGDNVCDINEDKRKCPKDCIICGDDSCDAGENRENCAQDCAKCGDNVCDINEDKRSCPEDCVVCGDNICDPLEITSLHKTTCPEDCAVCGDGYCDEAVENKTNCPDDCKPKNLTVCGDGICNQSEKDVCAVDCSVCGDNVCDRFELISLHKTTCTQDCAVCGDGYCDKGESKTCDEDCNDATSGLFIGYFLIPLVIAILIVIFETMRHYVGTKYKAPKKERVVRAPKMMRMDMEDVLVYFAVFTVTLIFASLLLFWLELDYTKNLALFDLGAFLLENSVMIAIVVITLAFGTGLIARSTYYMERGQAIRLFLGFTVAGLLPGLLIFHNIEYLMLLIGMVVGITVAVIMVKKEESEFIVKKPFKIGFDMADKTFFIASLFLCLGVFLSLYLREDTGEKLAASIWNGESTRSIVRSNYGYITSEKEVMEDGVDPFFSSKFGGLDGKLVFSVAVSLVLLIVLKLFTVIIKLLAGFFSWLVDKTIL
ncbi:MAG: hypothetical protein ABIN58_09285 [candidate division WOR-3 bacterium]